jgi:8-oxo-dGTP diphosphatase
MPLTHYSQASRLFAAVDCIIFGFDGFELKLLVVHRNMDPERGKWSLMGGIVSPNETCEQAATVILKNYTGLEGVYLEQLHTFSELNRDPIERVISVVYFALIDINQYAKQLTTEHHAEWFSLNKVPKLIFDHERMVEMAKERLQYKAASHPILFELMPPKFTLPQLQSLYEGVYETELDKRNFSRKLLSTGLLVKQKDKDKLSSKKGAYYYKLDKKRYSAKFRAFLNFIPNAHKHIK